MYNCQIRAAKPTADIHNAMPNDDARKKIWWDNVDLARINNTKYGTLSGNALKKARRIVNQNGGINISGEYGSIEIDEKEFHLRKMKKKRKATR